jgi:hypothetical protein
LRRYYGRTRELDAFFFPSVSHVEVLRLGSQFAEHFRAVGVNSLFVFHQIPKAHAPMGSDPVVGDLVFLHLVR